MRTAILTAALAVLPAAALAAPPGAGTCADADRSEAAYKACVAAVMGPCEDTRAESGDGAWAACLSDRAAAWETEVARRTRALREMGDEAGQPVALAAFLAKRNEACRDPERIAALMEEHGQAATDGAILRCELANSLHRALLLDKIAREAAARE